MFTDHYCIIKKLHEQLTRYIHYLFYNRVKPRFNKKKKYLKKNLTENCSSMICIIVEEKRYKADGSAIRRLHVPLTYFSFNL